MEREIYKIIEEYPDYQISNYGNVKSFKNKKETVLTPWIDSNGKYYLISLCKDNKKHSLLVHRLVCKYFVSNPNNYNVVNHIDHNTHNNYFENLEWCTTQQNVHHSYITMPPDRNKRKCTLIFPDGTEMIFESYADIRRYRKENNLDFAEHSLNYYGYSRGFTLIKS